MCYLGREMCEISISILFVQNMIYDIQKAVTGPAGLRTENVLTAKVKPIASKITIKLR